MKISAGILPFKKENNKLKVFLVHMGGPFWAKRDSGAWSIPKGEIKEDESLLEAAKREFFEETGKKIDGDFIDLKDAKTSNKIIHIFAINKDIDTDIKSNFFEIEWPPNSGKIKKFPEVDKAKWFDIDKAYEKIVKSQRVFLDRLKKIIA
ncbi:NUDIX domain-containing protein [Nitrosophilus kaiyonis]|uniref:NUDIX domain-containing protein n=1 Tax=Nitrosophilus kaiyonis TaxID=2930200 RepID=UPI0024904BEE|nr:NUDIX domain-containing protein [Nitrosophilus kaiyonis]